MSRVQSYEVAGTVMGGGAGVRTGLAGITGVVLAQMMAGEATLESVHTFRPERFWNW